MKYRVTLRAVTTIFVDVEADDETAARELAGDQAYDDVHEVDRSAWRVTGATPC